MRLRVETVQPVARGFPPTVRVVDADTGVRLSGVSSLHFEADAGAMSLTVTLFDFDVAVEVDEPTFVRSGDEL